MIIFAEGDPLTSGSRLCHCSFSLRLIIRVVLLLLPDGRSQMSLGVFVLWLWWCCRKGVWSNGWPGATLLHSDVWKEGGTFFPLFFLYLLRMHGGLIKHRGPARLMGLIAYYAGSYIMSNRLLLSLPVNEASHTSMGVEDDSNCLEEDKTMCLSCPLHSRIFRYFC